MVSWNDYFELSARTKPFFRISKNLVVFCKDCGSRYHAAEIRILLPKIRIHEIRPIIHRNGRNASISSRYFHKLTIWISKYSISASKSLIHPLFTQASRRSNKNRSIYIFADSHRQKRCSNGSLRMTYQIHLLCTGHTQ